MVSGKANHGELVLDRKSIPSADAGETLIVGPAPAVGNAIFDVTGVGLRLLPAVPNGLKTTWPLPSVKPPRG